MESNLVEILKELWIIGGPEEFDGDVLGPVLCCELGAMNLAELSFSELGEQSQPVCGDLKDAAAAATDLDGAVLGAREAALQGPGEMSLEGDGGDVGASVVYGVAVAAAWWWR